MSRSRDFLERFRAAGGPGAPSATGVPADRSAELAAELEPVLARLDDVQAEAGRLRAEARHDAERMTQEAGARAAGVVAAARLGADAERADAAARMSEQAREEAATVLADAERTAEDVRRHAEARLPEYRDVVLAAVRDALGREAG